MKTMNVFDRIILDERRKCIHINASGKCVDKKAFVYTTPLRFTVIEHYIENKTLIRNTIFPSHNRFVTLVIF